MRQKQPIFKVDKFSGAGQNGILYCRGFYPEVVNGKSVMGEGFTSASIANDATTGFSNIGGIYGSVALSTIYDQSETYNLYINSGGYSKIFAYKTHIGVIKNGQIHSSSLVTGSAATDIIETSLGNILYPSEKNIGRGVRFKATGGSTTTIIDTTKNFVTLGYATNDKVTNLKTGIEYTITSITTTTNTNDTLNFSASGTNTTSANDECIAWEDDRFDTNITKENWQQTQGYWVKQFASYANEIFFTNGNYIGSISASDRTLPNDESTVYKTRKQLPVKHQAIAISVNNAKVLVSANYNGKGALLLWDGASDGWNNILKVNSPVIAITEHQSGWIFILDDTLYFTDGFQLQVMYKLNQNNRISSLKLNPYSHNGLAIADNILYCSGTGSDINLTESGVYAIDLDNVNNGFTLIKQIYKTKENGTPISVFVNNRFSGSKSIEVGGSGFINYLAPTSFGATYRDKSLIMAISLPEETKISGIGLNLSRDVFRYNDDTNTTEYSRDVQVAVGDGKRGLIDLVFTNTIGAPTTTFIVDGRRFLNTEIGDEFIINDTEEVTDTERSFITDISNKGGSGETWTIDPALSTTHKDGTTIKMVRVKKFGRKTITNRELNKEILFFPETGLYTNKIYLEIVFFGKTYPLFLNINEINIYGE